MERVLPEPMSPKSALEPFARNFAARGEGQGRLFKRLEGLRGAAAARQASAAGKTGENRQDDKTGDGPHRDRNWHCALELSSLISRSGRRNLRAHAGDQAI